jgi:predicted metal-dependent hydrolase
MKTKWASCSTKKNLTINRLMRYLPEHLLEYIIFHEIVHLFEKQHNDRFWEIVAGEYPAYEEIEKDLFVYWFRLVGHDPRSCL